MPVAYGWVIRNTYAFAGPGRPVCVPFGVYSSEGDSKFMDAVGGQPPEWWILDEDTQSVMPGNPDTVLFSECPPAVAKSAIARLRPHSARSVREPLRAAEYGAKPATYVICERDAALAVDMAKALAALAQAATVFLDADHHPMLSRPAELALILVGIVARTTHAEPATS